jgi:hypothetical protein
LGCLQSNLRQASGPEHGNMLEPHQSLVPHATPVGLKGNGCIIIIKDLRPRLHETGTKSNRDHFVSAIVLFINRCLHETGTKSDRDHFVSVIIYNRCLHETGTKITQTGLKSFRLLGRAD